MNIKVYFSGIIDRIRTHLCGVVMSAGMLLMVLGIVQAAVTKALFSNFWFLVIGFIITLAGSYIENKEKRNNP